MISQADTHPEPPVAPRISATGRTAVAFIAHRFDEEVVARFDSLRRACLAGGRDVFIVTEPDAVVPEHLLPFASRFDFAELRQMAAKVIADEIVPGSGHLRFIAFSHRFPGYRHYWFIEYDVVYRGDWTRFFDAMDEDDSDLLACSVRRRRDVHRWYWRRTLETPGEEIAAAAQVVAHFWLARFSPGALNAVADAVARGWSGHYEIVVPTAVVRAGFSLADIGGSGEWAPAGRRNRHYLDCNLPRGQEPFGTMRYRPEIGSFPIEGMLYHPVKTSQTPAGPGWPISYARVIRNRPLPCLRYFASFAFAFVRSRIFNR
ncbi:DUF3405 domain-containing protein [Rhizobium sp. NRK18]|uniref:DUF3405 domain-containing protein n=1 Tax=Rhizobium sp. NRK18 TaxID=2964667 RepID=UPI0021C4C892|nr:DUF3405 domain-containing protein [Rhizobium sp. NRK18]MCQ2004925.1 DUF3405 domain-containing protein [Rhizobium sp. NRK18]